ncbi:MAG: UMP kinase, partial [Candidatus Wildermuthbacteria bacterium]|nr:UMP kinase [Candidatus Wildermuthbacteria bacterium]
IHSTRLNAHLLITIFRNAAYPVVLDDPHKPIKNHWRLLIASGWRPGCSTDTDSTLMARRFKIKEIINAGNISFVFDKDPAKNADAKLFKQISWRDYRKIIGSRWTPGMSTPFDPIASKLAQKLKIRVLILKGTEIKNLEKAISGENFDGTIIS